MSNYLDRSKVMLFKKSVESVFMKKDRFRKEKYYELDQKIVRRIKEYDKGHRINQNWRNILSGTKFRSKEDLFDYFRLRNRRDQLNGSRVPEVISILYAASNDSAYILELLKDGKFNMAKNSNILDRKYASMLYYRLLGEYLLEKLSAYAEFIDETEKLETILSNYDFWIFKSILEEFLLSVIQLTENHLKNNESAFEMMINTNKELTERLDEKSDNFKAEVIKELYLKLNNVQTDFLLDKISVYANLLKDNHYHLPNIEVRILIHTLLSGFDAIGLEKIGEIGDEVLISHDEDKEQFFCVDGLSLNMNYRVSNPGWKIANQVLKMAEVKKVEKEGV